VGDKVQAELQQPSARCNFTKRVSTTTPIAVYYIYSICLACSNSEVLLLLLLVCVLAHRYLYLGTFKDEQAAAKVWDLVAVKTRGTGTPTNFPVGGYLDASGSVVTNNRYDTVISSDDIAQAGKAHT
jgi:hypothetical protein